jgi:hypothetical protein
MDAASVRRLLVRINLVVAGVNAVIGRPWGAWLPFAICAFVWATRSSGPEGN